ncbi:uncharacterized protein AMSG_05387 [Thecamonas trahens ATCC 50062]|uniref:Polymorphic outer membrane protein n=1 Tax=Thecamonas trahens ATCC 50062 TaxID=461836 RepID=A0A0L0DAL8_THETB|nr:hypothetical protein AMSG_05387 [Thecamonas trahens ATCC 50062]KNC49387.1 hypothetical protein AMSG_05387 [Thecamonas trahens ATCC 50062]|eukprot:XP_013757812.1 hypothetical protein AMSG_05387 [Thecamonas trahens ATCC 50062]
MHARRGVVDSAVAVVLLFALALALVAPPLPVSASRAFPAGQDGQDGHVGQDAQDGHELVVATTVVASSSLTAYVAPDGSDSPSCGPPSLPCASIGYAFNISREGLPTASGLTLSLAPGVYEGGDNCGLAPSLAQLASLRRLTIECSGGSRAGASCARISCPHAPFFLWLTNCLETTYLLEVTLAALTISHGGLALAPAARADVGGVFIDWPSQLTADDIKFEGNVGRLAGGLWLGSGAGPHTLSRVTFVDNAATESLVPGFEAGGAELISGGGGLRVEPASHSRRVVFQLTASTFTNNTAGTGGGLGLLGLANMFVADTVFTANTAAFGGGLYTRNMYAHRSSGAALVNSTFAGNSALIGGGLAVMGGSGQANECRLVRNEASVYGGALYLAYSGTLNMTAAVVTGNSAGKRGGGVFAVYSEGLVLFSSTVEANKVASRSSSFDTRGSAGYLAHVDGMAAFPGTLLAGDDALFCDHATSKSGCVPCHADACAVCFARDTGCVASSGAGRGPVVCATLSPSAFADNAVTGEPGSLQACSCADTDSACSGAGACWWDFGDDGYCMCTDSRTGATCSLPRKLILIFSAVLVGVVAAAALALCTMHGRLVWHGRRQRRSHELLVN